MTEAKLSKKIRDGLGSIDYRVTQILDAGIPGPSDLMIEWEGRNGCCHAWLELKHGSAPYIRPEQRIFLKERWRMNRNSFLLSGRPSSKQMGGYRIKVWRGDRPNTKTGLLYIGGLDIRAITDIMERAIYTAI